MSVAKHSPELRAVLHSCEHKKCHPKALSWGLKSEQALWHPGPRRGGLRKVPAMWQGLRCGLPPDSDLGLDLLGKTPALFTWQRQQARS